MRCINTYYLLLCLFFFSQELCAQKEGNIWYFGNHAGLDFNSGTAVPLYDGQVHTQEGVATISNSNGNLLFYTDGVTIWNQLHRVMPNGTGLPGHTSSTQSAIVVPKIGDAGRYYVFTMDVVHGVKGLQYSVVNMALDSGRGDVETKNIPLMAGLTEKLTAVKHCNKRDVWIIAHKGASYYAFLVTPLGVHLTPVISNTGSFVASATAGYLKASPDGRKIAAAHNSTATDISDFDNATGLVSNTSNLYLPADSTYRAYGIEFSPNGKMVYVTATFTDRLGYGVMLLQYDVSLSSAANVRASKQIISQIRNSVPYQALQIGPDGKIYVANVSASVLGSINFPNVYGPGCGFVSAAVQFNPLSHHSWLGLPSFIQSWFYKPDSFAVKVNCPGNTAAFQAPASAGTTSVLWDFGDPASGADNTSTLTNPVHRFSAPGVYNVQLISFTNCGADTVRQSVQTDTLSVMLSPDTLICGDSSFLCSPLTTGTANTFLWQDGSTTPYYRATISGLYWVEVKNKVGCIQKDSILINFQPRPLFSLGKDTSICENGMLTLNATAANADSYSWNTGDQTPSIQINKTGLYWCETRNSGCSFRDSLLLTMKPAPVVNLGNDSTVCEGTILSLDVTWPNADYLWQDGTAIPKFRITQPGTYFVQVTLNGCQRSDTLRVAYTLKPRVDLGADRSLCAGDSIILGSTSLNPSSQFRWQDGSTAPRFTVKQPGMYSLTATNNCGSATDYTIIEKGICGIYIPTGFTPNSDGKNDVFKVLGVKTSIEIRLQIFNRWGQKIFETMDKTKGWDGKYNGADCDAGAYVYLLHYGERNAAERQTMKGSFVLIR
jgi:gliding motility-associated-like protein